MSYTENTPVSEPIEVRYVQTIQGRTLTAWVTPHGTIAYKHDNGKGGPALSLSYLQSTATFPTKAVPGWQAEVIAFIEAGIGTITEVR